MAKSNDTRTSSANTSKKTGTMDPNSTATKQGRGRPRKSESAGSASSTPPNPQKAKKNLKEAASRSSHIEKAGQKQNNTGGHNLKDIKPQPTKAQQNSKSRASKRLSKTDMKKGTKTTTSAAPAQTNGGGQLVAGASAEKNVFQNKQPLSKGVEVVVYTAGPPESIAPNTKQPLQVPSSSAKLEAPRQSLPAEGASNQTADTAKEPLSHKIPTQELSAKKATAQKIATETKAAPNPHVQAPPRQVIKGQHLVKGSSPMQSNPPIPAAASQHAPIFDPMRVMAPGRTPPLLDPRFLGQSPALKSPELFGPLQPRLENSHAVVEDTGVPVEEVNAFIRRFIRLADIECENRIYPRGSDIHTETTNFITSLTLKWQSAKELNSERYSLEHCTTRGKRVGRAIFIRAQETHFSGTLRGIMEFFDKHAKMSATEIEKASKDKNEARKFKEWGYVSWIGVQYMDQRFFEGARDAIIECARFERKLVDREKLLAEQAVEQKLLASKW